MSVRPAISTRRMAVNFAKLPELPRREGRTTEDVTSAQP